VEEREERAAADQGRAGLTLKRVAAHRYKASLTAAQALTGKYLVLQRYAKARRAWKTVKRVTLRTAKAGVTPTVVSSTTVRVRIARARACASS
jgi:hypothetical protein